MTLLHAAAGARCCDGGGARVPRQEESTARVSVNVLCSEAVSEAALLEGHIALPKLM